MASEPTLSVPIPPPWRRAVDSRLVLGTGFAVIAVGCFLNAKLDSQWAGSSFWPSQLVLALGQGLALNGWNVFWR